MCVLLVDFSPLACTTTLYHALCKCVAVLKVLKCVEGLRYDVQQLTKQQERLTGLLQQLVDNRPVNDVSVVPPEFDFELPVDTKANLMELEQKLQQKQQLHSLVCGPLK